MADLGIATDSYDGSEYIPVLYLKKDNEYTKLIGIAIKSDNVFYTLNHNDWIETEKKNIYIGADYTTDDNKPYFR